MIEPCITTDLVRSLIADQFPQWAHLPIRPLMTQGWDNRTFHLGAKMTVRLPSAQRYAAQVAKEQTWLPRLAPHLQLPIPNPIAKGHPTKAFPFDFSIMEWLPGNPPTTQNIAVDLAHFLNVLRLAPTKGAPPPGQHNFHRGGDLRIYDQEVRYCLEQLHGKLDQKAALRLWTKAGHSQWTALPVWLHGYIVASNLLQKDGRLTAVIDFGNCAVGDPACDLTIGWTFFAKPTRDAFMQIISLDPATWEKAKGWALWKALLQMCSGKPQGQRTLDQLLARS